MAIPGHVFVPYADMSLSPTFSLAETAQQTGNEFFTLAFIVAGSTGQGSRHGEGKSPRTVNSWGTTSLACAARVVT